MSSETAKPKEKDLYSPYMETLKGIFDHFYLDESYVYTHDDKIRGLPDGIENPHLEITAYGVMSEKLQKVFDFRLFAALYAERLKPDIMGFVKKNSSRDPEIITVEVKAGALTIKDVLQAKLYSDVFSARFAFAISPEGISIPKLQTILKHDKAIRGNVIIVKYRPKVTRFQIYRELKDSVPKELQRFCE